MNFIVIGMLSLLFSSATLAHQHHDKSTDDVYYQISDVNVKPSIPGVNNTTAHFSFTNKSDKPIRLIGAKSKAAKVVEIHEHVMIDGLMKMQKVNNITIPANGEIVFKPGGYHIMFIGLYEEIKEGDNVEFFLILDDGKKISATAIATTDSQDSHKKMHHHHQH